jgi:hypothetical protein
MCLMSPARSSQPYGQLSPGNPKPGSIALTWKRRNQACPSYEHQWSTSSLHRQTNATRKSRREEVRRSCFALSACRLILESLLPGFGKNQDTMGAVGKPPLVPLQAMSMEAFQRLEPKLTSLLSKVSAQHVVSRPPA